MQDTRIEATINLSEIINTALFIHTVKCISGWHFPWRRFRSGERRTTDERTENCRKMCGKLHWARTCDVWEGRAPTDPSASDNAARSDTNKRKMGNNGNATCCRYYNEHHNVSYTLRYTHTYINVFLPCFVSGDDDSK